MSDYVIGKVEFGEPAKETTSAVSYCGYDRDEIEEALGVNDPVEHPKHYTNHPSGVECIQITEHMGFNLGNAMKYIWRADLKNNAIEDLEKAVWYIRREIERRR